LSNAIRPPPSSNLLPQGCDLPTYLGDETLQRVRLSSVAEREIGRLRRANLPGRGRARERDGANHFAERHAAFDGWPAAWPVSNQYRQISASSFAPMRMGSREVPHAGGQAIPRRRLPRSETPARTGASRGCVAKSRPLLPPFRYVSVVPLTGDLEFNSSPKEQSVKRITLRKIFRRPGSMTPHAAIRPLLGRKYSEAGRCSIFARPVNMHLGSKRRALARSNCGGSSFNFGRWEDSDILVPLVALSNGAETTIILLSPELLHYRREITRCALRSTATAGPPRLPAIRSSTTMTVGQPR
jgi:hypothetical protein